VRSELAGATANGKGLMNLSQHSDHFSPDSAGVQNEPGSQAARLQGPDNSDSLTLLVSDLKNSVTAVV
jgi:hypothetical protein